MFQSMTLPRPSGLPAAARMSPSALSATEVRPEGNGTDAMSEAGA